MIGPEVLDGVPLTHRILTVGKNDVHCVEAGTGPTVLLLHGFPEFWYSWRNQIPALVRAGFRTIAIDLRGYGDSSKPAAINDYRLPAVVDDIAGVLVQSGGTPCAVVGHDWGGLLAWFVPMMHPALVSKLVVLNTPHPVPYSRELRNSREQRVRMIYQLFMQPPVLPEMLLRILLPTIMRRESNVSEGELRVYAEAWRPFAARRGMVNYYRALRRNRKELRSLVRPIEIPTMLLWGEREPVFTRATTERFEEYVPNLRIVRVPEARHFVQADAPDVVNRNLVEFLR
ncbi:MAG: alpha/beta fold hydrolase [Thermoanaerobaculia bacterium]